ncbi:NADP-dependent oxidoreductase domain-containing protein [Microdochium bolleyi]|uniref:NADP-dependent oxidoreductase domain-containing protein n=1 Tax=Microdochium bolleyi TaxID=196109 RepID=A0A136IZ78_9PEZI|nr:NADP-dependent oxidoreductase domain-containing protein [Microdochium bolleyi]
MSVPRLSINSTIPLVRTSTWSAAVAGKNVASSVEGRIPILGLGVYRIKPSDPAVGDSGVSLCQAACQAALEAGYRHIDTARLYRNESQVADAVSQKVLSRKDVFLTTKIRESTGDAERDYRAAMKCVERLPPTSHSQPYVDLLLIHQPPPTIQHRRSLWQALERLQRGGRALNIGVSNYRVEHLEEMRTGYARETSSWPPCVNQIEVHPWFPQTELTKYCAAHGIVVQAFAPLAQGRSNGGDVISQIGTRHGKTQAQVLIRWSLQKGFVALPKSSKPERIRENADVFDFELDGEDMHLLDGLDKGGTAGATYKWNRT